jgi:phosphatidylserine/phosphatidylglycerophosphate/cardiolipin synthase-like enzyme
MIVSGIKALDDLIAGPAPPIGPDSDPVTVGAVQDLLRGHGFARMPGPQGKGRGHFGPLTTQAVADFCQERGLPALIDHDGLLALISFPAVTPVVSQAYIVYVLGMPFTGVTKLVALLTRAANSGRFADVLTNMGKGGLAAGILPWVQRTRDLNTLISALDHKHAILKDIFGGDANVTGVLNHTNKPDGGLNASGQTTDANFDLVKKPWTSRIRRAGLNSLLQSEQVEAARLLFQTWFTVSILPKMPGLTSERAVAFGLDLIIQFGIDGAEAIFTAAKTGGTPDTILLNRMRDISVDQLRSKPEFLGMPQIAQGAFDRRNFLLSTPLLSDAKFVPDTGAPPAGEVGPLPRYFLPLGNLPFQRTVRGTTATTFILGESAFKAMLADIKSASGPGDFIYILSWHCEVDMKFDDSDANSALKKTLASAAATNVEIRALLWGQTPVVGGQTPFSLLPNFHVAYKTQAAVNTVTVDFINTLSTGVAFLDGQTRDFGTHHQKLLVIKSGAQLIAYVGGIEANSDRLSQISESLGSPLFDFSVRLEDKSAWLALQMFILRWRLNTQSAPTPLLGAALPIPSGPPSGNLIVQMTQTRGMAPPVTAPIRTAADAIVNAIGQARRYFYIEDQYFVGNPRLAVAIFQALNQYPSLKGVVVITPDVDVTDFGDINIAMIRRRLFLHSIERLFPNPDVAHLSHLKNRLLMFERLGDDGTPAGKFAYVHSKLLIIDDQAALFGSVNMNARGWSHDTEIYATVVDTLTPAGTTVNDKGWVHNFRLEMWKKHFLKNCDGDIDKDLAVWQDIHDLIFTTSSVRNYDMTRPVSATPIQDLKWNTILDPA